MYENRTIEYSNFYANELEYDLHGVIEREKICLLVVELLLFEIWVHGWCTATVWMKIISFPAEERGVLMRETMKLNSFILCAQSKMHCILIG